MTTRPKFSRSERSGFTLVELMVVITVIGLLVGMLVAAVIPVMTRAREAAIQFEMKQIEQSIENFRTENGFYPPSFQNISDAAALARYIGRIAPNHQEGNGAPGTRIAIWWDTFGGNIQSDEGDDLVFWLSGLFKNAQFPLTNGATTPETMPSAFDDGTPGRNVYYEFRSNQLEARTVTDSSGNVVDGVEAEVAYYSQAAGVESPWLYIDSASYDSGSTFDGYHILNNDPDFDHASGEMETRIYENPNTFQLICAGIDKELGPGSQWAIQSDEGGYEALDNFIDQNNGEDGLNASDNICNFCEGRLELLTTGVRESPAVQ